MRAGLIHPAVLEVMKEVGIDLSRAKPQKLTPELAQDAYLLVTMGCGDECPFVPGVLHDDWPLPDPKGQGIAQVRMIRDEIEKRIKYLIKAEVT
jgi:protein-tyrosine-phosphatase